MSLDIKVVTSSDGDWVVVLINGSVDYEGHSIPDSYWIDLLSSFGFRITSYEISKDAMVNGDYYEGEE